ncbi:Clr5 domain-containing protein [Xylaria nigripes]|nr:Clr5 domain-containing protein [Xylaria nigripes]
MTKLWHMYKDTIKQLYLKHTLKVVITIMKKEYNFRASTRSYRSHLQKWGVAKYERRQLRSRSRPLHARASSASSLCTESSNGQHSVDQDSPDWDSQLQILPPTCFDICPSGFPPDLSMQASKLEYSPQATVYTAAQLPLPSQDSQQPIDKIDFEPWYPDFASDIKLDCDASLDPGGFSYHCGWENFFLAQPQDCMEQNLAFTPQPEYSNDNALPSYGDPLVQQAPLLDCKGFHDLEEYHYHSHSLGACATTPVATFHHRSNHRN